MTTATVNHGVALPAAGSRWRALLALPAQWEHYFLALLFFAAYSAISLLEHRELRTGGWDLGIFDQAIRGYAHFGPPISDIKAQNFNLYGDHFHPIIALIVPLYWIHSDATTLLVAQAALLAVSIIPIARLATKVMGRRKAVAVAIAYGLSFGIQDLITFDFHEVAFAVPLLAFGLVALVERRWLRCVAWSVPLLLVKEEFGLYLAAIGVVLFLRGQRRLGIAMGVTGVAVFGILVGLVIPHFSPQHADPYLASSPSGVPFSYLQRSPGQHGGLLADLAGLPWHLVNDPLKLKTWLLIALVTGLLGLRSPLMLVAAVNVAIRFEAGNSYLWTPFAFHYNAVLMPIAFVACLDAYPHWQASRLRAVRLYTRWSAPLILVIALGLAPHFPATLYAAHIEAHYERPVRVPVAFEMMSRIPDGALVEASNLVAAHLTDRCDVVMWPFTKINTQWVLVDTDDPYYVSRGEKDHVADLESHYGYEVIEQRDDYILLRAPGA